MIVINWADNVIAANFFSPSLWGSEGLECSQRDKTNFLRRVVRSVMSFIKPDKLVAHSSPSLLFPSYKDRYIIHATLDWTLLLHIQKIYIWAFFSSLFVRETSCGGCGFSEKRRREGWSFPVSNFGKIRLVFLGNETPKFETRNPFPTSAQKRGENEIAKFFFPALRNCQKIGAHFLNMYIFSRPASFRGKVGELDLNHSREKKKRGERRELNTFSPLSMLQEEEDFFKQKKWELFRERLARLIRGGTFAVRMSYLVNCLTYILYKHFLHTLSSAPFTVSPSFWN